MATPAAAQPDVEINDAAAAAIPTPAPPAAPPSSSSSPTPADTMNTTSAAAPGDQQQQGEGEAMTTATAAEDEALRVVVTGFKKWLNAKQVAQILQKANIIYDSLKRPQNTPVTILRFISKEQRDKALEDLQHVTVKGKELKASIAMPEERRLLMRRERWENGKRGGRDDDNEEEGGDGGGAAKRHKTGRGGEGGEGADPGEGKSSYNRHNDRHGSGSGAAAPVPKNIHEVVTPLLHLPYPEQLIQKQEEMAQECVKKMFRTVRNAYHEKNKKLKRAYTMGETGDEIRTCDIPQWVYNSASKADWHVRRFVMEDIKASPVIEKYRNKSEFTIAPDAEGLPTVGFRMGNYREGNMVVAAVEECVHLDAQTKKVVEALQGYVRREGALPIYDVLKHEGVWRYLTVRTSQRTGDCLVMLCVAKEKLSEGVWEKEQAALVDYLTAAVPPSADTTSIKDKYASLLPSFSSSVAWTGITSLYLVPYEGLSNPTQDTPLVHLWGQTAMEEELLGLRFRVSPQAFFQTNTAGCEVLYQLVIEESRRPVPGEEEEAGEEGIKQEDGQAPSSSSSPPPVILDVCCGTGTIGICAAAAEEKKMKQEQEDTTTTTTNTHTSNPSNSGALVLGIEMCKTAVDDAIINAQQNHIHNAAFICSRAEEVLLTLLRNGTPPPNQPPLYNYEKLSHIPTHIRAALTEDSTHPLVAIVDPPRQGLHADCLRALRNCRRIERLVYVSCNPTKSLIKDVVALCGPASQKLKGEAFRPVKAIPVDMFPHTSHCEMVLVLSRGGDDPWKEEGEEEGGEGEGGEKEGEGEGVKEEGQVKQEEMEIMAQEA